jgi:FkbM family methyltransferase
VVTVTTTDSDVVNVACLGKEAKLRVPDGSDPLQDAVRTSGEFFEGRMLEELGRHLPPGGVIDVGANIGNHAVFFGAICGRRVLAFEPNPRARGILEHNVSLNGLDDIVTIRSCALGAAPGRGALRDPGNLGAVTVAPAPDGEVEIQTLDAAVRGEDVRLIKVDVGGQEESVLRGAMRTIRRHLPALVVDVPTKDALGRLEALLRPLGYVPTKEFNATPTFLFEVDAAFAQVLESGWSLARIASDRQDEISFVVLGSASAYTQEPNTSAGTPAYSRLAEMKISIDAILPATQHELSRLTAAVTELGSSLQSPRLGAGGDPVVHREDQDLEARRRAARRRAEALAAQAELLVPGVFHPQPKGPLCDSGFSAILQSPAQPVKK